MSSLARHVFSGVLLGVGVATVVMVVYCIDLASPLSPGQGAQARDDNTKRVGDVILFGVVYLALTLAPTAAAVGGALGVIVYIFRRLRTRES